MARRKHQAAVVNRDVAEANARRGSARERAFAFAQIALEAAVNAEPARMARCLEAAQRERRRLSSFDQVVVLDRLARAAIAVDAAEFAWLLHSMAVDYAGRVRRRCVRAEAVALCEALKSDLNDEASMRSCA